MSASPEFSPTRWSLVSAVRSGDAPRAREAMEKLCHAYWYPLYAYVRRCGEPPAEAQDLTQGFFARFIEKNYLHQADRERGRFRSFLLGALKHFMADEWDLCMAVKRGGRCEFLSLDDVDAEARYRLEPADGMTPERTYDRRWALAIMQRSMTQLEEEYAAVGRREMFIGLQAQIAGGRDARFAAAAVQVSMTEGAAKMAVQRMRRRYREILCAEVGHTVGTESEIEDELRYLLELVSN